MDINGLATVDLTGCTALQQLNCSSNPGATLVINDCVNLIALIAESIGLNTIDISFFPNLTLLFLFDNTLTVLSVNTILTQLVTFGLQGGSVDTSGQTPAAPPSVGPPDGIAAVATLTGYATPWSVTTD